MLDSDCCYCVFYTLYTVFLLHVVLIDGLDGHLAPCQLVDTQSDLPECPFADQLHKLVELERSRWELLVLPQVQFIVSDEPFSLAHYIVIHTEPVLVNHDVVNDLLCCSFSRGAAR